MPEMQGPGNQNIILAITSFSVFMATLDTSILNISLPTIAAGFHTDMGSGPGPGPCGKIISAT